MQSDKPYSNATFTRDADQPAKRTPGSGLQDALSCSGCGAAYLHRRWTPATDPRAIALAGSPAAARTLCPACRSLASDPLGYLHVEGAFFVDHQEEIERLIEREGERADGLLGRIVSRAWAAPGELVVATTTAQLAQRLGHALHTAYWGTVTYRFSHESKLTRVTWHRD